MPELEWKDIEHLYSLGPDVKYETNYDIAARCYITTATYPDGRQVVSTVDEDKIKRPTYTQQRVAYEEQQRIIVRQSQQIAKLKKDMAKTATTITEAYEKELRNERQLRAEAEKLNEHLHDQVSDFRRKLQGRDESYSSYPDSYSGSFSVSGSTGNIASSTFSTSRKNPSKHWVTPTDDTV